MLADHSMQAQAPCQRVQLKTLRRSAARRPLRVTAYQSHRTSGETKASLSHGRVISNSLATSSSCSEASYSEWLASKPLPVVAQEQAVQEVPAPTFLPPLDLHSKGHHWRIRQYADADLLAVTELQARSFHEGLPFGALDALAYTMFKAEVLDAVKKKATSLTNNSFSMMVVEELQADGGPVAAAARAAAGGGGSWDDAADGSSSSSSSDIDTGLLNTLDAEGSHGVGDFATALANARNNRVGSDEGSSSSSSSIVGGGISGEGGAGGNHEWLPGGASSSSSATTTSSNGVVGADGVGAIAGVIEVSIQDELEVLRYLSRDTTTYAYVSSMAVAEQLRRKGVATAMLAAAEQQARVWNQSILALHVYVENEAALKLYKSFGLESVGSDPSWKAVFGGKIRTLMVKKVEGV